MVLEKVSGCINHSDVRMNNKKSSSNFLGFALVAAVVGGVGAAVMAHPKGKQIRSQLKDVGDDFVDALERAIDKVDEKKKEKEVDPVDVSDFFLSVYDELKQLNGSVRDTEKRETVVKQVEEKVVDTVERVQDKVDDVSEDISDRIKWLQNKGRSLAKRATKGF